jgi:tRNA G18 (ribose-2'-O)-methylase SpoU
MSEIYTNGFNVHDHLKNNTLEELQEISMKDRLNFSVCLFNLDYDNNIGNCIRTSHIMGAKNVYIFGKHRFDSRSTVGCKNYTNIIRHTIPIDLSENDLRKEFNRMMVDNNMVPLFIEKNQNSISIDELPNWMDNDNFDYWYHYWDRSPNFTLVFGNENKGIPDSIGNNCNRFHIPQLGVIRSLNVASAAAIAMYEMNKYCSQHQ